jgi:methylenetetrahydrofolate--tRNA-(uracil-5-)-methyltransferase
MDQMGSLLLACARATQVPAGSALAVDREHFSALVTHHLKNHPRVELIREEMPAIPGEGINIIATGPLTSERLFQEIAAQSGNDNLFFYDAIAPSVTLSSLNQDRIFKASRYGKGDDDYYNCPLNREEYERFWQELTDADIFEGHSIDQKLFFPVVCR